uniref:Uncharacterized protein n=1 Tax=Anopheles atroparvus TaxID=41427 RepID=A0A182IMR7_ANOAO
MAVRLDVLSLCKLYRDIADDKEACFPDYKYHSFVGGRFIYLRNRDPRASTDETATVSYSSEQ